MNNQDKIDLLNRLLESEFTGLECYRAHASAISESEIAECIRSIIPVEHAHAVSLTTRISELGGNPARPGGPASVQGRELAAASKQQGTQAMLKVELELEQQAIKEYAEAVADIVDDMITVDMLEEQLLDEMRHAKWLKQQIFG
jgi:bacterioferritin (cytochrome b1)